MCVALSRERIGNDLQIVRELLRHVVRRSVAKRRAHAHVKAEPACGRLQARVHARERAPIRLVGALWRSVGTGFGERKQLRRRRRKKLRDRQLGAERVHLAEVELQDRCCLRGERQARLAAEAKLAAQPMKPQRVYAELRRVLPPETIVALDAGAAPAYGYDRLSFARPRTFLTPLDLGGLGFAFPVALGAKLGRPQAPVVAIHGDGGYLMNSQELETAVRHNIGVVTIVMNNNCWGSEKAYQKHFYGGRYIGCDIGNPRYDQFARLFGAAGYYVEHPDQVGDAVQKALSESSPAVIEIPIDPDEFPTPVAAIKRPE